MRLDKYVITNLKKLDIDIDNLNKDDNHKVGKLIPATKEDKELFKLIGDNTPVDIKPKNFELLSDKKPSNNNKIDNAYLYGVPSDQELQLSNWQSEQGLNNKLNDKILQAETGESFEDFKTKQDFYDREAKQY